MLFLRQAEEDDRRVEIAHDRFVMNDIARAAARQLVGGAMNSDANARAMLAVADLSGNDNVVVKKRRSGGANSGSANLYGYSADDAWDVDHADDDNGRYVSASNLADEVEDDLEYVYCSSNVLSFRLFVCILSSAWNPGNESSEPRLVLKNEPP
jgi:hypothetical protein